MSIKDEAINLRTVLRHAQLPEAAATEHEARLDALLRQAQMAPDVTDDMEVCEDPMDRLRRQFTEDLIPVFDELSAKYAASGVAMSLDASRFLDGGRDLAFSIEFADHGLRFDGTATEGAIAFNQTRFKASDRSGLTSSGPSLRTRDLDRETFRSFICARIVALVQSVLNRR